MSSVIQATAIDYPESDGRPMGETDLHRDAMVRHIELLKYHWEMTFLIRGSALPSVGDIVPFSHG